MIVKFISIKKWNFFSFFKIIFSFDILIFFQDNINIYIWQTGQPTYVLSWMAL